MPVNAYIALAVAYKDNVRIFVIVKVLKLFL